MGDQESMKTLSYTQVIIGVLFTYFFFAASHFLAFLSYALLKNTLQRIPFLPLTYTHELAVSVLYTGHTLISGLTQPRRE